VQAKGRHDTQAVISTIRKQAVASAHNDKDYNEKLKAEKPLAQL